MDVDALGATKGIPLLTALGVLDKAASMSQRLPRCSEHPAVKVSGAPFPGWVPRS